MCCRTHDEACYMHAAMMIRLSWHTHLNHVAHIQVISHTYEAYHKYTSERISHTYELYHIYTSHFKYIWVTSHIYKSFHIYMSHITYTQVSAMCKVEWERCNGVFSCVAWPIHMCDMTLLYVWHDTFTSERNLPRGGRRVWRCIHMCDMTYT